MRHEDMTLFIICILYLPVGAIIWALLHKYHPAYIGDTANDRFLTIVLWPLPVIIFIMVTTSTWFKSFDE
jgi:hypothetical protein